MCKQTKLHHKLNNFVVDQEYFRLLGLISQLSMYSLTKTVTRQQNCLSNASKKEMAKPLSYVCPLEVSDERKFIQLFSLDDSVVNSGFET